MVQKKMEKGARKTFDRVSEPFRQFFNFPKNPLTISCTLNVTTCPKLKKNDNCVKAARAKGPVFVRFGSTI